MCCKYIQLTPYGVTQMTIFFPLYLHTKRHFLLAEAHSHSDLK